MLRTIVFGLVVAALGAQAQGPTGGRGFGPGAGRGGPRFLGAEAGMPGRVVKNAPYSADVVTERVQTLPDGNHIRQTSRARVYRDGEGRVRREQSLSGLGALAPGSGVSQVVFITDPVAGANFALNPNNRTATRTAWAPGRMGRRAEMPGGRGGPFALRREAAGGNVQTESLGRQTIEGLQANGTRTIVTIPAGQVGNEQPLQTVRESWYSPDLQIVVLSKVTDPRFGETTYRVTNITRGEPAHAQFEVPPDYKISVR